MADGYIEIDTRINEEGAEQGIQSLQGKLEASGKKMEGIGKGLTAGVTAPIVAVGGVAIKTAADFESAQGKMQAQLGLTAAETEKYGGIARDMWKNAFGDSIGDATGAIATVKQNIGDLNDQDLQKVTEGAFTLRDVFEKDIGETTAVASVMMKNFGIDATDSMDLMTVGIQKGGDYSGELLDTMREYSPMFATMGHSAEDMMNILISGAEAGAWNMDKVGDAVKEFNIRAKDGSKGTAEGFEAIGLNAEQMGAAIAAGGEEGERAFQATIAGLAAMEDPIERNAAGVALFGTQWEDLETDVISAMGSGVDHMEGFQGATERAGEAAYDTFGSRLTTLWRTTQDSLIPLGEAMLKIAEQILPPLISAVTFLADAFSGLGPTMQMGIVIFGAIAAAIGPVLIALGSIIGAIAPLLPALSKAWSLLSKLKTVFTVVRTAMLLLTGPVGIISAIVVALGVLIYQNWDAIKAKTIEIFGAIASYLPGIWAGIKAAGAVFLEFFKNLFLVSFEFIKVLIANVWTAITEGVTIFFTGLIAFGTSSLEFFKNLFVTVFEAIKTAISTAFEFIKTIFTAAFTFYIEYVTTSLNLIKTVFTTVFNAVKTFLSSAFEFIKNIFVTLFTAYVNIVKANLNFIKTTVTTIFNFVKSFISSALNATKDIIVNVWNVIKNAVVSATNSVKSTVSTAFNFVKSAISSALNATKSVIVNIWNSIKSFVVSSTNSIKSTVTNVFNSIKTAISNTMNGIKTTVKNAFDSVLNTVKGLGTSFFNAGKGLVEQIIKGIKSMIGSITDEMSALAAKMRDFLPFSPAKVGPLSDLDKLDFGGPVGDSIKSAIPLVRSKMAHLLKMPQLDAPDAGRGAALAAGGAGAVATVSHGDTTNHFTIHTQKGQDIDIRALSQALYKLQKRDQKGAGRK